MKLKYIRMIKNIGTFICGMGIIVTTFYGCAKRIVYVPIKHSCPTFKPHLGKVHFDEFNSTTYIIPTQDVRKIVNYIHAVKKFNEEVEQFNKENNLTN